MGTPHPPAKALLFISALCQGDDHYHRARPLLESTFGDILMESHPVLWDFSDYYREEMGEPLHKRFIFLRTPIDQDTIALLKLKTNEIERMFSTGEKRTINLDPGYLTPAKIVLASTKDYSHRIYLRDGIFAEVTLMFKNGRFVSHLNTYRDYLDGRVQRIFIIARNLFFLLQGGELRGQQNSTPGP